MGVSKYTPELADEICERLANGETLRGICRDSHMPSWFTIYNWVDSDSDFASRFARARQTGCDAVLDEVMCLADTPLKPNDRADIVAQRRMQIDTRFKFIARVNPAKYGDRAADGAKTEKVEVIINTMQGSAQVANADTPTE